MSPKVELSVQLEVSLFIFFSSSRRVCIKIKKVFIGDNVSVFFFIFIFFIVVIINNIFLSLLFDNFVFVLLGLLNEVNKVFDLVIESVFLARLLFYDCSYCHSELV